LPTTNARRAEPTVALVIDRFAVKRTYVQFLAPSYYAETRYRAKI